jgi:3-oxoacyl-[acyl-carrier protein] reductase
MDLGLKGKVALVFGASGGLGAAMASSLAAEGAKVALAGRNMTALSTLAASLRNKGADVLELGWDLADLSLIDSHFEKIESTLGPVDILINNTGGPPPSPAANVAADLWEAQFRAMVVSVIKITDRALPQMRARKWGRIITSTSSGVIAPIPNLGVSNALRATLVGWSKTLAREVAADGITCNVILPGRIATPRIAQLDQARAGREKIAIDDVVRQSLAQIPAGRYGDPAEYGDVAAFLASARASYVTGTVVRVDGGYIASI